MSNRIPSRKSSDSYRKSTKKVPYGLPRKAKSQGRSGKRASGFPLEQWHEPVQGVRDGYRIIEQDPGNGFVHPVSVDEIIQRLGYLPSWILEDLDVIQLSQLTRKKLRFPCYGLQWGTAVYLYPVDSSLTETYSGPPSPRLVNETRMFGGVWKVDNSSKTWTLEWSEKSIRDFYLNNILIHELGHLVDDRNTSYVARERYADWFAIEYGYRSSRQHSVSEFQKKDRKRHHSL